MEERLERLPLGLKILLSVLPLVVLLAVTEGLLALAGVRPVLVDEDPYVGFQSSIRLFEPTPSGDELRTAPGKLALPGDASPRDLGGDGSVQLCRDDVRRREPDQRLQEAEGEATPSLEQCRDPLLLCG